MTSDEPRSEGGAVAPTDDHQPPFPVLDSPPNSATEPPARPSASDAGMAAGLDFVLDVPVRLSVELGRTELPIRDIVNIGRGAIIELDGEPGAPLEVRANGVLIGRGEVVVINEERLGLRFVEVVSQADRLNRLNRV
jgi:flagellar motor switch protein FliN